MLYKGKTVLINNTHFATSQSVFTNFWGRFDRPDGSLRLGTEEDLKKYIKSFEIPVPTQGTLYFGATSNFPRFKLTASSFKRCIKPSKGDAMVMGEIYTQPMNYPIYEGDEYIYIITPAIYVYQDASGTMNSYRSSPYQFILNHKLFKDNTPPTLIANKGIMMSDKTTMDITLLTTKEITKIVRDVALDKAISSSFSELDEEAIKDLNDLLDSPDSTNRALGLKLLTGYNVQATPLSLNVLLSLKPNLKFLSEWNSVGVSQVKKSINFEGFFNNVFNASSALSGMLDSKNISETDRNLAKSIIKKEVEKFIHGMLEGYVNSPLLNKLGLKIEYSVQE